MVIFDLNYLPASLLPCLPVKSLKSGDCEIGWAFAPENIAQPLIEATATMQASWYVEVGQIIWPEIVVCVVVLTPACTQIMKPTCDDDTSRIESTSRSLYPLLSQFFSYNKLIRVWVCLQNKLRTRLDVFGISLYEEKPLAYRHLHVTMAAFLPLFTIKRLYRESVKLFTSYVITVDSV